MLLAKGDLPPVHGDPMLVYAKPKQHGATSLPGCSSAMGRLAKMFL